VLFYKLKNLEILNPSISIGGGDSVKFFFFEQRIDYWIMFTKTHRWIFEEKNIDKPNPMLFFS
jgi:hypothetical protein